MIFHSIVLLILIVFGIFLFRRQQTDLFDLHILTFGVTVYLHHYATYLLNPDYFDDDVLYTTLGIFALYFLCLFLSKRFFLKTDIFLVRTQMKIMQKIGNKTNIIIMSVMSLIGVAFYLQFGFVFRYVDFYDADPAVKSFISSFLRFPSPIMIGLLAAFLTNRKIQTVRYKCCYLVCSLPALFFFVFLGGRRTIYFVALLLAVIYLEQIHYNIKKWHIVMFLLMCVLVPMTFDVFQKIRGNFYDATVLERTVGGGFQSKIEGLLEITSTSAQYISTIENIQVRANPILCFYDVVKRISSADFYTHGEVLYHAVVAALPSFIYPTESKKNLEDILTERYHVPLVDISNTFLLEMYVDFGLFSVPITVALLILCPYVFIFIDRKTNKPLTTAFCFGALFLFVVPIENTLIGYLSIARDALIVVVIDYLIAAIRFAFKPKTRRTPVFSQQ